MKLGAHLSIAGGYTNALKKTRSIGGNCLQIFATSPRGWRKSEISIEDIVRFIKLKEVYQIDPVYFHASYLLNLTDCGRIGSLSVDSLINELTLASKLKIKGTVVHLGSYKRNSKEKHYQALIDNISRILSKTPDNSLFIIENSGTRKIGRTIDEIGRIINDIKSKRIRVCLDTCHLHASGYDISTQYKLNQFLHQFDRKIGIKKLELIHANDSRDPVNSLRDRHENIGKGKVGIDTFKLLLNHPKTKNLPFIIETPGFNKNGPDKKNLDILKRLS
jgi:deoxyribonuclease-4